MITMATGWLLLLAVIIICSQFADSQPTHSTTDDDVCELGKFSMLQQQDMHAIISTQQQILQQLQTIVDRLDNQKMYDCSDVYNSGERSDGVYSVHLGCSQRPVEVYCDMTTDGGGWTVFQRRKDGSVNFYRGWADYAYGFGNPAGEFWLGNDNIHLLTSGKRQQLRVDLADFEGHSRHATYNNFRVDSASTQYKLASLGTYTGTAGDGMNPQLGQKFSTRDQDNDVWSKSCAVSFKGAWWYSNCHSANLNGQYLRGNHSSYADGVNWDRWKGQYYSMKFTEMKIRPF